VNDLLRTMLDMHRAASKQLQVDMAPVDLLHDVLEPVGGMLYQRGSKVKLIVECPGNLIINTDSLRLKQVVLNLGRNSTKFIQEGFIRLKAEEVNGSVKIYVDDSGCGIPLEKRELLFAKFQESLDVLSQGTVRESRKGDPWYPPYSCKFSLSF
jgi:signal transduction histidine kinase